MGKTVYNFLLLNDYNHRLSITGSINSDGMKNDYLLLVFHRILDLKRGTVSTDSPFFYSRMFWESFFANWICFHPTLYSFLTTFKEQLFILILFIIFRTVCVKHFLC